MKEQSKQACDEFLEYVNSLELTVKEKMTSDGVLNALAIIWSEHW